MKQKTTTSSSLRWDNTRWVLLAAMFIGLILVAAVLSDGGDSAGYERGHQALAALDCQTAVAEYDVVINNPRLVDVRGFALRAGREKEQCQLYQKALDLEASGQPGDAAATLYTLMRKYESSPLYPLAKENLTAIVNHYNLDSLASDPFCQEFTGVVNGAGLSETSTEQIYPRIVDACGKMYEASGQYATAITWYDAFLEGHLAHVWTEYFREALARSVLAEVSLRGASSIHSPVWTGEGTGSTFALNLFVQSPQDARLILTGPSTHIVDVAGCPDCKPAVTVNGACQMDGRPVSIKLPVGTYQVVIESGAGESSRLYHAAWAMDSGQYEFCITLE